MVWAVASLCVVAAAGAALLGWHLRWMRSPPGSFRCKIRVAQGWLHGYSPDWPKRTVRVVWARDVLIVFRRSVFTRVEGLPVECARGKVRTLPEREVSRLGRRPVALQLILDDGAHLEVAARAAAESLLCGPYLVVEIQTNRGWQSRR